MFTLEAGTSGIGERDGIHSRGRNRPLAGGCDRTVRQSGSEGSVTKLVNRVGGRDTEIVETVESKHLPEEMTCIYEARGFWFGPWNKVTNRFRELSQGKSEWKMECEFCCRGFVKVISCLMSCLMPGMFRKATLNEMTRFKAFAEEAKGI